MGTLRQAQVPIVSYPSEPLAGPLAALLARRPESDPEVEDAVRDILRQVREEGDAALCEMTRKFDGVEVAPEQVRVSAQSLAAAEAGLEPNLRVSIEAAVANIRAFHERQKLNSWFVEDGDGVLLGKKITPIERVGLCVPAGEVPLFSSLLMTAVPAQVAGVDQLCVVSPPVAAGEVHPTIAAAAHLLGIEEVYAVGGAQAVGALAYGTERIRRVDKIVGPGSPYTVAAQRQVFGAVGIALLPGPSEIVVLADEGADPRLVAADLLSQAEHGWGVASVCITDCAALAHRVQEELEAQRAALPRHSIINSALEEYGALVVVPNLEVGIELLNRLAPEHAELQVADPWRWVDSIRHCGALFLGAAATEPVGDYFAGTNHVLPTQGAARYASSLGVADFVKTTSIIDYSAPRLARAAEHIARMARAEGLEAHARAVEIRQQGDA